jgi:DNA polymerase-4
MDAFFAAIEQREDPSLRGRPVVVGGSPDRRGVVSTASYEARRYGIHSAMPAAEARRRCPDAVFLTGNGPLYSQVSAEVFALLEGYSPLVEPVSIDEAFLDVTGCEKLFGSPREIARTLQHRIREELSLSASLGVAPNKFLAKLASDYDKPGGLVVVAPDQVTDFLWQLPLSALWGVGAKSAERLRRLGLRTVRDVAHYPADLLEQQLGEYGRRLHDLAWGRDDSPVSPPGERKSVSAEITFPQDTTDREFLESTLLSLSQRVAGRLRRKHLAGCTVTLKLRFSDFQTLTRSHTSPRPLAEDLALYRQAQELLAPHLHSRRKIRLLGVGVSNFASARQPALFAPERDLLPLDQALDRVRDKFGSDAITRGRLVIKEDPPPEEQSGEEETA